MVWSESVCQQKNFENRSIINEDMDKSKAASFLWPTVYINVFQLINLLTDKCIVKMMILKLYKYR